MNIYEWMVFNYILQKGTEHISSITDEDVKEMEDDLKKQEAELEGTNKIMIMTPEFQVSLVNDARKICNQDTDQVMAYIKKMAKNIR